MINNKAIVLVSGGLDSTTCLAFAKKTGFDCYALSFDYGQRHRAELIAAAQIATALGASEHRILSLSLGELGGSALTDNKIAIPDYQAYPDNHDIPITYVPARNTVFLSIALGWAEIINAQHLFIGVSAVDYSGYPDCRPEYIAAFQRMADLATKTGIAGNSITIHTPLIHLDKAETIQLGMSLGVDYRSTISCYQANEYGEACGRCDSCVLRKKGFAAANILDPTRYVCSATVDINDPIHDVL